MSAGIALRAKMKYSRISSGRDGGVYRACGRFARVKLDPQVGESFNVVGATVDLETMYCFLTCGEIQY